MNRFEQLIEYVINDEEHKAQELFHDIVVEKSRQIYENLMAEEAKEELDDAEEEIEESAEEEIEEGAIGGDASDDLIDDVECEEESDINMEADGEEEFDDEETDFGGEEEFGSEAGGEEAATKDDILNLEDKLDQLMAEFEDLMGDGEATDGDDFGPEEGGDAIEIDDTEEMDETGMFEAVSLKPAPKPTTSEEGTGKAGPVAFNSGAAGMAGKPVGTGASQGGRHDAPGAYSNTTKELGVKGPQDAAKGAFKTAAPRPVTSQASGVNTKSPLPKG
jgi:hypothetical protein